MGLSKYKLGDLISIVDERNNLGIRDFYGINIDKEFMPTVADTEGLDETKYKVVRKNRFVFSGMQTGRDQCIRISMYDKDQPIIVSPAYTTFEILPSAKGVIMPMYFFMLFLSKEKDRLGAFYSDGSIRSNLDWERFCDIELELPSIDIQQKYVDIYNAALRNQQCYELGLEDLKLVCDGYMDLLKHTSRHKKVGNLFKEVDSRNNRGEISDVRGINISKRFMPTVADMNEVNLSKYKVVNKGQFAFSGMQTGRDGCIRISLSEEISPFIISPAYSVFEVSEPSVLPEYIMLWFSRKEIDRSGWFLSDASVRTNLDMDCFFQMEIPVPDIDIQKSIADVYQTYNTRHLICEQIKTHIKSLCPILIKGSILEAGKQ